MYNIIVNKVIHYIKFYNSIVYIQKSKKQLIYIMNDIFIEISCR